MKSAPVPVPQDVAADPVSGSGQFDFSGASSGPGMFVYLSGKASGGWPVVWMDSASRVIATVGVLIR